MVCVCTVNMVQLQAGSGRFSNLLAGALFITLHDAPRALDTYVSTDNLEYNNKEGSRKQV